MVASGKKTWKLSPEQLEQRREMLGRELDAVAKKRDALRSAQVRLAEVKELIKATPEGQEQEELKASIKEAELLLDGLHGNVERLSREVLTGETSEPQDPLPGVDTSKPPKAPRPPKPSAAERTLQLPEVAGPGLTGEAELHEGGPIAPEAPAVHLALPAAPRHPDAVDGEIVVEAEPSEANVQRAVVRVLAGCDWLLTGEIAAFVRETGPGLRIEESAVRSCLLALQRGRRVERHEGGAELGESWRLLPEPPKAKGPKKGEKKARAPKTTAKGKTKPKKAAKGEKKTPVDSPAVAEAPPPCPPPPAQGHPQRVLRSWIHDRVACTVAMTPGQLLAESPSYHREYIEGTLHLLLACELMMRWDEKAGTYAALEIPEGRTVDQVVLDAIAHILLDAPLTLKTICEAMDVPPAVLLDVLQELREQGRVEQRGTTWALVGGKAAE